MPKRLGVVLLVSFAVLFLLVNRAAYQGYFQDDEIDNLSWTRFLSATDYLKDAFRPVYFPNNFRPVGHFYFFAGEKLFGLGFPGYVAILQGFHIFNVWLLWLLARKLGAPPLAAAAGCAFFGFHMALFDAVWKPMYVFDVLCATGCLASLLLYARGRWIASLICFWLAYKAKELAVVMPLVLAAYELWFGERRWKRLLPFFTVSMIFGLQAAFLNPNRDNDYTFRFSSAALAKTSVFYSGRIFLAPYLGFVLPLAAWMARNRRTWFGLAVMAIFFAPLLFLPGRMFSAYCYVPFTALAIAIAGVAEQRRTLWLSLFFLLWFPVDYRELRTRRNETLARDTAIRAWMTGAGDFIRTGTPVDAFVYEGAPEGFNRWGVEGALKYFLKRPELKAYPADDPELSRLPAGSRIATLKWDPFSQRVEGAIASR